MTSQLLIDPALLVPPDTNLPQDWQKFWLLIIDWNNDRRVHIGPATFKLAVDDHSLMELAASDERNWPPHTKRDRIRAVSSLLARLVSAELLDGTRKVSPEYCGPEIAHRALLDDLPAIDSSRPELAGLATSSRHWCEHQSTARCVPPPPDTFELCFKPNGELQSSKRQSTSRRLHNVHIKIVGGQQELRIIGELTGRYSIEASDIEWIPAEITKKPNLESCKGLRTQDVAICISGRIGHADYEKMQRLVKQVGATWIEVRQAGMIQDRLEDCFGSGF